MGGQNQKDKEGKGDIKSQYQRDTLVRNTWHLYQVDTNSG